MGDSKAVAVDGSAAIPTSITNLAALQYLAMGADGSQLTGTYEGLAWLSSLSNLQSLDLSFLRALEFPAWVTHLYNLQCLNVNGDEPRWQGLLSDDISHLTALTSLSLFGNNLEGYVPKSFSSFLNLQYLHLSFNYLSGYIPRAFTTNIQSMYVSHSFPQLKLHLPPHNSL
ncbi:unnamed protein product [Closterium sp. NIES-65]|nr:unnamed protein product [Closterium sp. NIES-65]